MNQESPMLFVRTNPKPDAAREFRAWLLGVHLAEARKIPGMGDVSAGISPAGTWWVLYTFESAATLEKALGSPEAAYARGTWESWDEKLKDRAMEVWAPLMASPIQVRQN